MQPAAPGSEPGAQWAPRERDEPSAQPWVPPVSLSKTLGDVLDDVRLALRSLSLASAAFAAASAAASSASRMAISSDDDSMCSMVASSSEAIVCITTMASCCGVDPLLTVMGRADVDAVGDELDCTVTGCDEAGEDSIV